MDKILLVEDDLSLIDGLVFSLEKQGFIVEVARTMREAAAKWEAQTYELLLLDVSLPDGTGFEICKKVRQTSQVPVIFLTAADEEVNVVMGLDLGGDDYITKPFKTGELISRIRALLRRAHAFQEASGEISLSGITLLPLKGQAFKGGEALDLTAAEYKLLYLFMQNPNRILSKETILDKLWDSNASFVDDNTLAVYIRRLRTKIEEDPGNPNKLVTVRGMGYKWNLPPGQASVKDVKKI